MWNEKDMYITHEGMFSNVSRLRLFWDFVIKGKGIRIQWCFSPPETETEVYVDYLSVEAK